MGTIDMLPFTGVTFPFVSNGGSAMISAWGMLAFVKAADIRQDASFAIKSSRSRGREVVE
jgi:cell division protein FtsW (lipid II flippase)